MPLRQTSWFRSVEQQYQYEPPHVRCSMTRFNSGNVRVIYFAPDPLLARFEARDILGQWFGDATPTFRDRHVVVEYRIDLAPRPVIVDAPPPPPPPPRSTTHRRHHRPGNDRRLAQLGPAGKSAPTQDLASSVFNRPYSPMGLIAPSARNPLQNNLILFADRLPRSVSLLARHVWHESQLSDRPPT